MRGYMRHAIFSEWATIIFSMALLWVLPTAGFCGTIQTTVTSHVATLSSGQVEIQYEVKNMGDEPAQHVTVATFFALEADQSGNLGDNAPGGTIRYSCTMTPPSLKPGNYVLATRIHFEDLNGTPHRVYHFSPLSYRTDLVREGEKSVTLQLSEPYFNLKGFFQPGGMCTVSLKNNLETPIRAIVALYLPDGFTTEVPERAYDLAAGEKKEEDIPFTMNHAIAGLHRFHAVVWHEENGLHQSQHIEKEIRVEERPVYFKTFLIVAGAILAIFLALFFVRKKWAASRKT